LILLIGIGECNISDLGRQRHLDMKNTEMHESTKANRQTDLGLLAAQYRELLELRERVETAEQTSGSCRRGATWHSQLLGIHNDCAALIPKSGNWLSKKMMLKQKDKRRV
jgi:hypothetical protein